MCSHLVAAPLLNAFTYDLRQNFLFGCHISSATTAPPCWRPFPFSGGPPGRPKFGAARILARLNRHVAKMHKHVTKFSSVSWKIREYLSRICANPTFGFARKNLLAGVSVYYATASVHACTVPNFGRRVRFRRCCEM